MKDSNITDLINDAMRERKTVKVVGRNQCARLLRVLNIPSALVRNKSLLSAHADAVKHCKTSTAREFHACYIERASSIDCIESPRKKKNVKITNKK